jgi:hypothetical protein
MNKHRFVWHDLSTKDLEASKRFYAGDEMIGGMRQMDAKEPQPTSWLGYIAVDDVPAAVDRITGANGKVHMPTTTMENVGTFAVTADPTGAVFAPWKSARASEDVERSGPAKPFTFSWDELLTTDPTAASSFYAAVFGWEPQAMDMGPSGTYTLFNRPGVKDARGDQAAAGGMIKSPPGIPHSFWMPYVQVESTDALSERAPRLGATITVPPTDIPNIGRFACFLDPQEAAIAIIQTPG